MTEETGFEEEAGAPAAPDTEEAPAGFVNPPGAGVPAGIPLSDPGEASPGEGQITLRAPEGLGLALPALGLSVSDQPTAFSPEDAARLQEAAAAQGMELIEGGGS